MIVIIVAELCHLLSAGFQTFVVLPLLGLLLFQCHQRLLCFLFF